VMTTTPIKNAKLVSRNRRSEQGWLICEVA